MQNIHLLPASLFLAFILVLTALPADAQKVVATVPVGISAFAEAVNPVTNKIYVANACGNSPNCSGNGTVTIIDGATLVTTTVNVGFQPYSIAVNPITNKIYVANACGTDPTCSSGSGSLTVIDGVTLATTNLLVGADPYPVVVNTSTNKIYVATCGIDPTCSNDGNVAVIDGATLSMTTVPVGVGGHFMAVNPATNKIYVVDEPCEGENNCQGDVAVIDGATLSTRYIVVGVDPNGVAVDSATNKIYVMNRCGEDFYCESTGSVTIVDGATLSTTEVAVGIDPSDIGVNSVTNKIYTVDSCMTFPECSSQHGIYYVTVIDGATLATTFVPVGEVPYRLAIDQTRNKVYVTDAYPYQAPTVTVIDGTTFSTTLVGVGLYPNAVAVNESTNRIYVANVCGNGPCVGNTSLGTVSVIDGTLPLAWQFVPLSPCRVVDTRPPTGSGPIAGGTAQSFPLPQEGACGRTIPATAAAYSLNVTAVPHGTLRFLTIWPTGQPRANASLMNSPDGRIKANAAIVAAGSSQAVSVYATDTTDVVLDINGYFVPLPNPNALAFYPLTPCRVADTRDPHQPAGLGPPSLGAGVPRHFPVLTSTCNIPNTARAYSMNFTVVPRTTLGYLTVWPTGESRPVISTLNDLTGTVVANAAIVPAGTGGDIDAYATNNTDLFIDINGYFAPPGQGGLSLYAPVVCRVLDTRQGNGAFSGTLVVNVAGTGCSVSSLAQAYVFNATVVPSGVLGYLTLWPDGGQRPVVSTLNAFDGSLTSNMAIVPTTNGSIDAFTTNLTQLLLDISGYFAP